jgi:hypothetical protein
MSLVINNFARSDGSKKFVLKVSNIKNVINRFPVFFNFPRFFIASVLSPITTSSPVHFSLHVYSPKKAALLITKINYQKIQKMFQKLFKNVRHVLLDQFWFCCYFSRSVFKEHKNLYYETHHIKNFSKIFHIFLNVKIEKGWYAVLSCF